MTCKDCLHYEACKGTYYEIHEFGNFDEEGYASSKCDHFKDKSKNIEVPCKVGDIITALWDVPTTSKYVPYLAEVKEFRQSKRNGEVVCTVSVEPIEYRGRRKEYRVNEFGKLLFFSYDEAAKSLKDVQE